MGSVPIITTVIPIHRIQKNCKCPFSRNRNSSHNHRCKWTATGDLVNRNLSHTVAQCTRNFDRVYPRECEMVLRLMFLLFLSDGVVENFKIYCRYNNFSSSHLSVADFCGEKLAWFFGITSPKYQYAIDEYNRLKAEVSTSFLCFLV